MGKPIRVFHLIKGLGRGGAEMLLPETLRHADRERFVYGYAYFLPWKDAVVSELTSQEAEVACLSRSNSLSILLAARRVARKMRNWKTDVLHCHLPMAGVVGRLAGHLASVPVIYTEHNVLERYHPLTRRANLLTWTWQDEVVAVSNEVAESLRARASPDVPVRVVLNGVDVDRFDRTMVDGPGMRGRLGISPHAPVVGTVAVFRRQKRLDHWLRAAHLLHSRMPEARFLVVGDGPLRDELERQAISLGLRDAVIWAGLQDDVRAYLAAMDVYMMSSEFEGLPIALLEAMSMGCAVVCTTVGGIPEAVDHGASGFLVEPNDPEALACIARTLLESNGMKQSFGQRARHAVHRNFSVSRMSEELESIYERLARRRIDLG